jgi:hypothetical protein
MPDQNQTKKRNKLLPQIYRSIHALKLINRLLPIIRPSLPFFLFLGLVLFFTINMMYKYQNPESSSGYISKNVGEGETVSIKKGSTREETTKLLEVVKLYPQYPDGYALLSLHYKRSNQCDKALNAIDTAIKLDPGNNILKEVEQLVKKCQ